MADVKKCQSCGAELPSNAPLGHCPQCLLKLGFDPAPEGLQEAPRARTKVRYPGDSGRLEEVARGGIGVVSGERIGRYKLLEQLGEGGMGSVWVAEQTEPVRRTVALKVIKPGMDSAEVLARFEAERQALALMDHPNIAKVLEAGTTPEGRPYFVMDLVKGIPFMRFCDEQRLSVRERLELFMHVCQAVQHAHQKGIIHRDLKPSNVLVALYDGKPVPKVIDFGVAKAMGQRLTERTLYTQFGKVVGTLAYMSPEQAEMNQLDIDTRSDIYSLGVLLFELLTGSTPLSRESLHEAAFDEVLRRIREEEPPKPSLRLSTSRERLPAISAQRKLEPAKLTKAIRGELDWIVMKALEKDRSRRYETANGFARDIERHLKNEPVIACPPSSFYRFQKTVRRHKLAFAAAGAVLLSLLLGLGGTTVMFFKEQAARHSANAARSEVVRQNTELEIKKTEVERRNTKFRAMLAEAARSDRLVAKEMLQLGQEQRAFAHLARACQYDPSSTLTAEMSIAALGSWNHELPVTFLVGHTNAVKSAQFNTDGTRIVTASFDKTACVWDVATGRMLVTLAGHTGEVSSAEFSPDGTRIVTESYDHTARVWDAATGETLATLAGHDKLVRSPHFSPDGTRIVTVSSDKTARVWDARSGNVLVTLAGYTNKITTAQFSPDGTRIVTAGDGPARVWEAVTGKTLATLAGHTGSARFSGEGTRIVAASSDGTACVWEAAAGKVLATMAGHEGGVGSAEFSPDGTFIVTAGMLDKTVRIWVADTGKLLKTLTGHEAHWLRAQFSPDGDCIVSVSPMDSTARVWDASTGKLLATLAGHQAGVSSAHFSSDGKHIVTVSGDKTARIWDATTMQSTLAKPFGWMRLTLTGPFGFVEVSPDGTRIVTPSSPEKITGRRSGRELMWPGVNITPPRLWDVTTGKMLALLAGHTGYVRSARFNGEGTRIVTVSGDGTARVWEAATGKALVTLAGHTGAVSSTQFSLDGTRIMTTAENEPVRVWDTATGTSLATLGDLAWFTSAQFSPDGTRVVTASHDIVSVSKNATGQIKAYSVGPGQICLWDIATGQRLVMCSAGAGSFSGAEFGLDGTRIITTSGTEPARLWDATTVRTLATLGGPIGVSRAEFSPDGRRIISFSGGSVADLWLWDSATGKALKKLAGYSGPVESARFSRDGTRIVTASSDTVRVWDATAGEPLATLGGLEGGLRSAQFGSDGTRIITSSKDGTVRVLDVLPEGAGPTPEWFPDFLCYMAQMRLKPDGELETLGAADWLALRERLRGVLRANASADRPYLRILRKYVRE